MNKTTALVTTRRALLPCLTLGVLLGVLAFCVPATAQKKAGNVASRQHNSKQPKKVVAYYSCLMDRDVRAKSPGKCPKCGMTLRAVYEATPATAADAAPQAEAMMSSPPTVENTDGAVSKMKIPDIEVLDQEGRKIHFYTDLVKGKTVAINFIFTTCTTICPPLGATFARVQKDLGERTGRDVQFISISVDPATDTPERMKAWGAKFKAGAGWTFVTGDKPAITELLKALGSATARPEDHTPFVLIGNDSRGTWRRVYGLVKPSQLVQLISDAADGKVAQTTKEVSN
jgi:cytochrome oxidase Cu insertion factor (SCO1/SenC/PrrC family)